MINQCPICCKNFNSKDIDNMGITIITPEDDPDLEEPDLESDYVKCPYCNNTLYCCELRYKNIRIGDCIFFRCACCWCSKGDYKKFLISYQTLGGKTINCCGQCGRDFSKFLESKNEASKS